MVSPERASAAMTDKRVFPRLKKRLVVEFAYDGTLHSGFTHDVSYTGFFVVANRIPPAGTDVVLTLHLPNTKRIPLNGKVVRSRRAPTQLASSVPSGFSVQLAGYSEEYTRFIASIG
jgi:Tfp pilus assembly protein PilZ